MLYIKKNDHLKKIDPFQVKILLKSLKREIKLLDNKIHRMQFHNKKKIQEIYEGRLFIHKKDLAELIELYETLK